MEVSLEGAALTLQMPTKAGWKSKKKRASALNKTYDHVKGVDKEENSPRARPMRPHARPAVAWFAAVLST